MATMSYKELIIKELEVPGAEFCITTEFERPSKSVELAKQIREVGNELFVECTHDAKMHERIWESYLYSIALSPNGSEALAVSYGNMSALLFHLCKYEYCIKELDKALQITESIPLKIKLLCRKAKCFGALGMPEKYDIFEKAKYLLEKLDDVDANKKELTKLVNKAKVVLDKNKVKVKSLIDVNLLEKNQKKIEIDGREVVISNHMEILARREKRSVFDSVAVTQNDQYGKNFVASRNIKPGEIIFVSKPYLLVPNFNSSQIYCNNCLAAIWSAIPCENCACCMYCSEECQIEAQQKYHDIECSTLQFIVLTNDLLNYQIQASFRAVIMAVKEFGNIEKLREEMNNIDSSTDGGFSKDGKFRAKSFISIFNFKNIYVEPYTLSLLAKSCCRAIISLTRFTSFFGNDSKFNTITDLIENEDVMFIGSLLLRVAAIVYNNGIKVIEQNLRCKEYIDPNLCGTMGPCCERGYSLNTLGSFIAHSCDPTVKSIKTEGCKEIWYAVQPLYKGDPLLECYGSPFYEQKLTDRHEVTSQILNKNCRCQACVENWPAVLVPDGEPMTHEAMFKIVVESREFDKEKAYFLALIKHLGFGHQKVVDELSKIVIASFDYFGQPSAEVCAAMRMLYQAFDELYGMKIDMPKNCKNTIGTLLKKQDFY